MATNIIKSKSTKRGFLILTLMTIFAMSLMLLSRHPIYYGKIDLQIINGPTLSFILDGKPSEEKCMFESQLISSAITAGCTECQLLTQTCSSNPAEDTIRFLGNDPIEYPSSRIANGVLLYKANSTEAAMKVCKESELQSMQKSSIPLKCFAPGDVRPNFFNQNSIYHRIVNHHSPFIISISLLIILLSITIGITYYRNLSSSYQDLNNNRHKTIKNHRPWLEKVILGGMDYLVIMIVFMAVYWPELSQPIGQDAERLDLLTYLVICTATVGWFWVFQEHYSRRRPFWEELKEIIEVLCVLGMFSGAVFFVLESTLTGIDLCTILFFNFMMLPMGRFGAKNLLDDLGLWKRPAYIIGVGTNARDAFFAIKTEKMMGYAIVGFVSTNPEQSKNTEIIALDGDEYPVYNHIPENHTDNQIIIALDSLAKEEDQEVVQEIISTQKNIHIIPAIRGLPLLGTQLSYFLNHDVLFLTVRNNLSRRSHIVIKRLFDLFTASVLLGLLSPLLFLIFVVLKKSGNTALYGHKRVGFKGKSFNCLKFRSMYPDADKKLEDLLQKNPDAQKEWNENFKLKKDPRITPFGSFLRRTSLDELPQLFNVLRGEMSLVGPRPIVQEEVSKYGNHANLYLQVLPGITGLWQVSGRSDSSYSRRVSLDVWYIRNWSLWYDVAILFKTINVIVQKKGAY